MKNVFFIIAIVLSGMSNAANFISSPTWVGRQ